MSQLTDAINMGQLSTSLFWFLLNKIRFFQDLSI